jgi:hypothetical protein
MPSKYRSIAGKIYLDRIVEFSLLNKDITRDINQHWTWPPGSGNMEGFLDNTGQLRGTHNHIVMFGDGKCNASNVCLLKGIFTDKGSSYLTSYGYYRGGIEVSIGNPGYQIGSTRSRSGATHSGFPRNPGIAIGGVSCSLLMPNQYMPQLRILGQRVIERQDGSAWKTEHDFYALFYQAFTDNLGTR